MAAIGTRLATPSSRRSNVPMQPISMHRPRKCTLSAIGQAHAVCIRSATGEWAMMFVTSQI